MSPRRIFTALLFLLATALHSVGQDALYNYSIAINGIQGSADVKMAAEIIRQFDPEMRLGFSDDGSAFKVNSAQFIPSQQLDALLGLSGYSLSEFEIHSKTEIGVHKEAFVEQAPLHPFGAPPPPANDLCPDAIPIACGASLSGTTVTATFDNAGTCTTTNTAPGVWYTFVGTGGAVTVSVCNNASYDSKLSVFSGSCASLTCVIGNDDAAGCGLTSEVTFTSVAGTTYYILVHGFSSAVGTFTLSLNCVTPPSGDCIYSLNMVDAFGDGWDGSTVTVTINGTPTSYTVTGATNTVLIGVNIGDIIQITYTSGGGIWENEISYSLTLNGGVLFSDGPTPTTGLVYTAIVDCIPPPASPSDCAGGITICSNQTLSGNSGGTGSVNDLNSSNDGCLAGEQQGTWYYFSPSTGGTIGMTISPQDPTDDYDFAIWGPYTTTPCPPPGPPARCSYAAPSGDTGMNNTALDNSEGAAGDKWVSDLTVNAGEIYIMYIDNWSTSGQPFDLTWQLGGGASLDCTVLPLELISFTVDNLEVQNKIHWTTASELNTDHFVLERSSNGEDFEVVGMVQAAGHSTSTIEYSLLDIEPAAGLNYYRLDQVDQNGDHSYSEIISTSNQVHSLNINGPFYSDHANSIDFVFNSSVGGSAQMIIYDLMGRMIETKNIIFNAGLDRVTVHTSITKRGIYAFTIVNETGTTVSKGRLDLQPFDR